MANQAYFRKGFTQDRDIHVANLRTLEDILNGPLSAGSGTIDGVLTIGDPDGFHLDLGIQTVGVNTYFIIAANGSTIITGLHQDGTWS